MESGNIARSDFIPIKGISDYLDRTHYIRNDLSSPDRNKAVLGMLGLMIYNYSVIVGGTYGLSLIGSGLEKLF